MAKPCIKWNDLNIWEVTQCENLGFILSIVENCGTSLLLKPAKQPVFYLSAASWMSLRLALIQNIAKIQIKIQNSCLFFSVLLKSHWITLHRVLDSCEFHWCGVHSCGVSKKSWNICFIRILCILLFSSCIFSYSLVTNDFTHSNLVHADFFQTKKTHKPRIILSSVNNLNYEFNSK